MNQVERVKSEEFLRDYARYVRANRPVIIVAPDALTCLKWVPEYLAERIGDQLVPVPGGGKYNDDLSQLPKDQLARMTIREYFEHAAAHPGESELVYFNVGRLDGLSQECGLPDDYLRLIRKPMYAVNLWISARQGRLGR